MCIVECFYIIFFGIGKYMLLQNIIKSYILANTHDIIISNTNIHIISRVSEKVP